MRTAAQVGSAMTHQIQSQFKQAMRRLAAGVSLISCKVNGERAGIAATAVCSLSTDPPSLVACVNKEASIHPGLSIGDHYCINLLRDDHEDISNAFGRVTKCDDKFAFGNWAQDEDGIPWLTDAHANIFCIVQKIIDYGSHSIFIGNVIRIQMNEFGAPLVYFDGGYL